MMRWLYPLDWLVGCYCRWRRPMLYLIVKPEPGKLYGFASREMMEDVKAMSSQLKDLLNPEPRDLTPERLAEWREKRKKEVPQ